LAAVWYAAFTEVNKAHGFPPEFQGQEEVDGITDMILSLPNVHSFVVEDGGSIVGGAFLWIGEKVAGIGPVFVSPDSQESGFGRKLMEAAIERAEALGQESIRLTQSTFNRTSLSLYAKLGFNVMEPLAVMTDPPVEAQIPGYSVRLALMDDLSAMDRLCQSIHGHSRRGEIGGAIEHGTARVAMRGSELLGYSTDLGYLGHSAASTNEALFALLASVEEFNMGGVLIPMRNSPLFQWCLANGMRIKFPATLMARGWYERPAGPFMPSVLF
jgi:predicted N-acetyltransferase YhbS